MLNFQNNERSSSKAFTLIEILLVLVIISILVALTIPVSRLVDRRIQEARYEAMRQKIISALESYRADYGEYPINSMNNMDAFARHYNPSGYVIDPAGVTPYTNLWFITNVFNHTTQQMEREFVNVREIRMPDGSKTNIASVEHIDFLQNPLTINYSLIWPLSLKPRDHGKTPFIDVPDARIRYVVWRIDSSKDIDPSGIMGHWMQRPVIVDPRTHYQWSYYCADGLTYKLWVTNNLSQIRLR